MKQIKLDSEEKKIAQAIERDEYAPIVGHDLVEIADAVAARKKDASLTIRVNGQDIKRIKQMAKKKGIAYQSYLAEVIHRVASAL